MQLVVPSPEHLGSYVDALRRGWSPDNLRGREAAEEQLALIAQGELEFLAALDDPEARGAPIALPDGTFVPRLPSIVRWIWDGEFCGSIGFRWQRGTAALPSTCLGHIGYAVVPWKRRQGYGTSALAQMLETARTHDLPYVEITTKPDNIASCRAIEANGGWLVERFVNDRAYGGGEELRFRVPLTPLVLKQCS